MLKLSFWEQFILTELAALQAALQFLQKLLAGQVSTT